jgi:hypothetical protein
MGWGRMRHSLREISLWLCLEWSVRGKGQLRAGAKEEVGV